MFNQVFELDCTGRYGDEDYTVNYWYDANNRLLESEKDDGYTETVTEYSYDDNGNQVEKEVWIDNSFDSSETSVYKMEQPSGLCRRAAIYAAPLKKRCPRMLFALT